MEKKNSWDAVCAQKSQRRWQEIYKRMKKMWEGRDQKKTKDIITIPLKVRNNARRYNGEQFKLFEQRSVCCDEQTTVSQEIEE
ncbi:uncharacterized protein N7503_000808 [Penicillium pulvis]|uniref:uncharacterized protein n=1 Tax=Penicillium pulvis TaxID=1562058 RepID=UPI002546B8FE|nr:uncharacterized protein N7503_000808 [Penicillium pulvis]KAJ5814058.1 hypothetical protein N7503_000808 [Penicillium pulvis]